MHPVFPYGKGEGGEAGTHTPMETSGHSLGPLLVAPETTIFIQWGRVLPRWSSPGKSAQPGWPSQLAGEDERASLPHHLQHRDPRGLSKPLPGGPSSLVPQSLSLRASLRLHLWAPDELLLLCCLSALGISEPLLSSGEVLGSGHTGTHCLTPSNASKEVCSPRAISHTQQMGSPTPPPRHTYKIHSLPPCPLAPSPAVQNPSERAGFLFQTFLAEE